ncbi:MAG: peptide/nickel transport system permease protein [Actinomycetota bacterium]|jgi:peptide/nickel transport system permease protein|nr:peptide/nickel transport system permease protein [Actinomycetota bacterium]
MSAFDDDPALALASSEPLDGGLEDAADDEGKPLSQWRLFRRRFLRHRLAMASLVVLAIIALLVIFAPLVTRYDPVAQDLKNIRKPPNGTHWWGTDDLGRDVYARVIYAGRISMKIGFAIAIISTLVGTVIGSVAGYLGKWVDQVLMRVTDLFLVIPGLAVLMVANKKFAGQKIFGHQVSTDTLVIIILSFVLWQTMARIVRGLILSLKEKEFVEAARASGASTPRIIVRHILPNCVGPIAVNATLIVAQAILIESVLSFLGFGVQSPAISWGNLVNDAAGTAGTPYAYMMYFPGFAIVLTVVAINFLGDGLRDAFDPQAKH